MTSQIKLLINGDEFTDWKTVSVSRSIKQLCGTFSLGLVDQLARLSVGAFSPGSECEIRCDGELVLSGYIDTVRPKYDARTHTVQVSGRSRAMNMIDCGQVGRQWSNRTLLQIADDLIKPFGLKVTSDVDVGAAFKRVSIEPGQTVFEFLEKLSRHRGVLLVSAPSGALLITRASNEVLPVSLRLGENILAASGTFSVKDRFHEYIVQGQSSGFDFANGESVSSVEGRAVDKNIDVTRRHVIIADGQVDIGACKQRALWQRNTALARGRAVTYTLSGWRHENGVWDTNKLISVTDEWMGFDDEKMLIAGVRLVLGDEGRKTELDLVPPESFDVLAIPEKEVFMWASA